MDIDIPTLIDIVSRLKQENGWTRIQWKKVAAAYVVAVLGQWTREEQTELALKKSFQKTLSTLYRNRDIKGWRRKKSETVEEVVHSTDNSTVRVPEDCKTLKEAVRTVEQDPRITTIVLGKGEHQIDGNYLEISSAMNIVGDPGVPKEEIVVVGGIQFKKGIQGNCHLQHLTLRQAKDSGVVGGPLLRWKMSLWNSVVVMVWLRMVLASSEDVPTWKCANVDGVECCIRWCLHHIDRCQDDGAPQLYKGDSGSYGLAVYGSSSTIQLVSPLTKEQVSTRQRWGWQLGCGRWW